MSSGVDVASLIMSTISLAHPFARAVHGFRSSQNFSDDCRSSLLEIENVARDFCNLAQLLKAQAILSDESFERLKCIWGDFQMALEMLSKYDTGLDSESFARLNIEEYDDICESTKKLLNKAEALARSQPRPAHFYHKYAWGFYQKKELDNIIKRAARNVGQLTDRYSDGLVPSVTEHQERPEHGRNSGSSHTDNQAKEQNAHGGVSTVNYVDFEMSNCNIKGENSHYGQKYILKGSLELKSSKTTMEGCHISNRNSHFGPNVRYVS